ncbi:hypothetical protein SAMN05661008_00874 [Alkalithermobacter thermoalcaliphilus JW-YL-7 = DSM 7308]|uniref:Uncharacterized protein n=1 Tax=Alkalithermobacter thermoalcaliphilus JW-YL-7 = DSM 7308 TaxID=1121328 RepID=A0A150FQL3_CLOPD|nr:hypothetical protein JWYL7_0979 [[Clostridium] paradoxum JW-YL-7 = DSM 7308]SHK77995.1 hypothetical protein SAMN05661008_00874 [[Clostridium] paradoxum JW-YL-7 = DSM 7308]
MNKKLKSSTDNQWISTPEDVLKNKNSKHNNKKTETNNQWTCTAKNTLHDKE